MIELLSQWNIELSDNQINQFDKYYHFLVSWNEKMNLTAITELDDVILKHFVDSTALLRYVDLSDKTLLDVGTGAGFPGVVLKILCPSCRVTLLDSLNKRIVFLNELIKELSLSDIKAVHGRAEDFAHVKFHRESYDFVTSRAVANLSVLSEYCVPFVSTGGMFVPYKSGNIDEELEGCKNALSLLNCTCDMVEKFSLPGSDLERSLVFIKKNKSTPKQYPRKAGTPSKSPL